MKFKSWPVTRDFEGQIVFKDVLRIRICFYRQVGRIINPSKFKFESVIGLTKIRYKIKVVQPNWFVCTFQIVMWNLLTFCRLHLGMMQPFDFRLWNPISGQISVPHVIYFHKSYWVEPKCAISVWAT